MRGKINNPHINGPVIPFTPFFLYHHPVMHTSELILIAELQNYSKIALHFNQKTRTEDYV